MAYVQTQPIQAGGLFGGKFINTFKPSYMRNHKAVNTKNLRCFPVCSDEHKDNGFCGNEVIVSWHTQGRARISDYETYAEFQEAEEEPRFQIGQEVAESELSGAEDKDRKRYLMKGEVKVGSDPNYGTVHFARESKGWHYGWMAGRGNGCHALHEMRVYLLERVSPNAFICRLIMRSTPFMVTSRKRQRKKKDDRNDVEAGDGESDDDDDDDDSGGRKKRTKKALEDKKMSAKKASEAKNEMPIPSSKVPQQQQQPQQQPQRSLPPLPPNFNGTSLLGSKNLGEGQPRFDRPPSFFAQPPLRSQGAPTPPGFWMSQTQTNQNQQSSTASQSSHTPSSYSSMQPPAFLNQRGVQWPFSMTPPLYQHPSTTPPMYAPFSTTPPMHLPFSFNSEYLLHSAPVSDSDVLESLLLPTPPSTFSALNSLRAVPQAPPQQVSTSQQREDR